MEAKLEKKRIIETLSKLRAGANHLIAVELAASGVNDLSPAHGALLALLYRYKRLQMKDIPGHLHRTKSTVNNLVNQLVKNGWVINPSCPVDRRCSYVELTPKAEAFREEFFAISHRILNRVWRDFNETETSILLILLEKLMGNILPEQDGTDSSTSNQ